MIQQLRPSLIGNGCFRGSVGRRDRSVPPPDAHPVPPCGTAMRGSLRRTRATAEQPVVRCDIWYDTRGGPPSRENYVNCITFRGTTAEHQVGASVRGASWGASPSRARALEGTSQSLLRTSSKYDSTVKSIVTGRPTVPLSCSSTSSVLESTNRAVRVWSPGDTPCR